MQPPDIEKGGPHYKAASNKSLLIEPVGRPVCRQDSNTASPSLGDRVLQRVCREVREQPQRLPLAAHRLGGLVNVGRLPYRQTWDALYFAALDAGAGEGWVLRCLYKGFAQSNVSELPSPSLWALVTGGVE
jgi:hypothetical protein